METKQTRFTWRGKVKVTPGVINRQAEKLYTAGHCHSFALAMHDLYGYPLYLADNFTIGHVIVRTPLGPVDIDGVIPASWNELRDDYGFQRFRNSRQLFLSLNYSDKYVPGGTMGRWLIPDPDLAYSFARTLHDRIGLQEPERVLSITKVA